MNFPANSKGLGVGQVFVFIIAALSFALIMIFGYKVISEFLQKGETAEFLQFKTDLEKSIKRVYSEFGAVREEKFRLPPSFTRICFVDLDTAYPGDENCHFNSYGCLVWKEAWGPLKEVQGYEAADENVFLEPAATGIVPIKVYRISVEDDMEIADGEFGKGKPEEKTESGVLCLPIQQGTFSLRLEGRGDRTKISKIESNVESELSQVES